MPVGSGGQETMEELIRLEVAAAPMPFEGERLTSAASGQVAIEHYHRYLLARELCRGLDVLDVACGEGYGSALLAQVARAVVGVDIDAAVIAAARSEFPRPNLTFEVGDAGALPLPDAAFDVVVSFETLEHLRDQEQFLSEIRRVLRPGGLLILSTPDREIYSGPGMTPNPFHVRELNRAEFEDLLRRHFAHVAFASQRVLIGSAIVNEAPVAAIRSYDRREETVVEARDGLPRAPYVIAIAGDVPPPPLQDSLYLYRSDPDTDAILRGHVEQALAATTAELAELKQTTASMSAEKEEALRLLQETRDRVDALEASTIWRASGPLRGFGSRFPAAARALRRGAKLTWWTLTLQLADRYRRLRAQRASQARPLSASVAAEAASRPIIRIPSSDRPVVSIIISTYGQVRFTLECLQSIADNAPRCPIEVLVVDDAYPDPEGVRDLAAVDGIWLFRNRTNLGFLRSCNAAARKARGRYLHMLNNDTRVEAGAIDALVDLLEARADAGMAGSKLMYPDGRLQEAGGIVFANGAGWNYGHGDVDPSRPEYNYVREVDYCSGASIMIRRELFEALGGFDEEFAPAYYEDTDLAFRIRERGLKVLYAPLSVVIHHGGISHGADESAGVKACQPINQARFAKRWAARLAQENYASGNFLFRARDRGRRRRLILVIDHYVPEPDRDAGSLSMAGVMESLVDAGWVVKFWPYDRVHRPVYTAALERKGVEVIDGRWPGDLATWLREHGGELDHVLVSRPQVAERVLPHLTRGAGPVLSYYGHDLHFARMRREADLRGDSALAGEADAMEELERRIWRAFNVVLYPSVEEAAAVEAMAPDLLVRPIVAFAPDTAPARKAAAAGSDILFVAGFAHPPNVDAAEFLVRELMPRLVEELGDVRVTLAGSHPTAAVLALASDTVRVTGPVSRDELWRLYDSHRVAVAPLRFGAGVKGKVVEALCRGLPLVTTSTGAQGIDGLGDVVPIRDHVVGLAEALKRLITDDAAWMAQSRAQTAFAQRYFTRQAMQTSVLAALEAGERAVATVARAEVG